MTLETSAAFKDDVAVESAVGLPLDADGNVESVLDASAALAVYRAACRDAGLPEPDVIGA
jgi:hypothetical protein